MVPLKSFRPSEQSLANQVCNTPYGCRVFSDSKVVTESPRKCSQLITKLLHIVTQGDMMSSSEVTEVFFGVTKLFQSNDASLRRMVYFFIKEASY